MALGDALYAELSGGGYTSEDDDDYTLQDALEDLGRGQSVRSLAAELGVPRSTLRGWLAGATPKMNVAPLLDVARSIRRAEQLAGNGGPGFLDAADFMVGGWIQISSEKPRYATVPASKLDLDPDLGERLTDAYLAGAGPERLAHVFTKGVGDKFYRNALRANKFDVITVDA